MARGASLNLLCTPPRSRSSSLLADHPPVLLGSDQEGQACIARRCPDGQGQRMTYTQAERGQGWTQGKSKASHLDCTLTASR